MNPYFLAFGSVVIVELDLGRTRDSPILQQTASPKGKLSDSAGMFVNMC